MTRLVSKSLKAPRLQTASQVNDAAARGLRAVSVRAPALAQAETLGGTQGVPRTGV